MKRIFTSFLFMMAGAFMTTVLADSYNIWVGDVQVTDANKNDISPSSKTAGTITFSGSTLTFNGVTMSCTNTACINIQQEGITVKFYGTNLLTAGGKANTIYSTETITLNGPKSSEGAAALVTLRNTASDTDGSYAGIFLNNDDAYLNIWNIFLTVSSNHYGIVGKNGEKCGLSTSCADIDVIAGDGFAAVSTFNFWSMSDYGMLQGDRQYDASQKRTENADGSVATQISFVNGLYVGGLPVRASATTPWSVAPSGKTAGTIKYSNHKLSLDGVTYSSTNIFVENYNVKDLEIESTGTNDITTNGTGIPVMQPRVDTKLTGSGTLKLTSNGGAAISTYNDCGVTIQMALLEAKGSNYGFWGEYSGTLTLKKYADNTIYKFAGGSSGNVYTGNLVMDNMDIWTNNTYFDPTSHYMMVNSDIAKASGITNGTWFESTDKFTYYPIYVGGTHVSTRNENDVHSPYITSGKVSYSTSTKTLTLDGVQFEATGDDAPIGIDLRSTIGEATLKFTGADQHWTADNDVFAFANTKTTITGDCARVYLTSNKESGISTRGGASVTLNTTGYFGCKGAKYGYWGNGATNEVLTLSKTTEDDFGYNFEGAQGAIYNVYALNLDNMDFGYIDGRTLPGCYFDATKKCVAQNGGEMAKGAVTLSSIKEKLPIYVAGKQLNNVYNVDYAPIYVGSPYISSGPMSVNYVPSTKTLTLDNATTVEHGNTGSVLTCGIAVVGEGVTIDVVGTNNITAGNYGIYATKDLTVSGSGNLNVVSTEKGALGINDSGNERTLTLALSGGVHTFQGKTYGFLGWNTGSLAIKKEGSGALYKFAGETADIGTTKNVVLGDGVRLHSRYTWFNEEEKAMYRYHEICKNSDIAEGIWIRSDVEWIDYPLYVCGHQLYGAYVDGNLKGPASGFCCKEFTGTGISYNPESKTLTLSNVKIDSEDVSDAVKNEGIDDLVIELTGESDIKVRENVFQLCRNTTITGDGTLRGEATADDGYGIWMSGGEDPELVLDGPTFEFKGQAAIGGQGQNNLSFNKGKLTFEPNDSPSSVSIVNLASVTFADNLIFTEPEGAYYSESLKAVTTDGENIYRGSIVVEEVIPYALTIAGVGVNSTNCTDILHDGVFAYDPDNNTLTINGDCTNNDKLVENRIEDLTIFVNGNSTLTTMHPMAKIIYLLANTTITGGKLTLKNGSGQYKTTGIHYADADGGTLTVKDAEIEMVGDGFCYGITGNTGSSLIIDNSDVSVSAHDNGCISEWSGITLSNCYIEQPEASVIKPFGIYGIEDHLLGSRNYTEPLVIKAGELTGINNANADVNANDSNTYYDLNGRKIVTPEKGKIYILNGKKVKK